MSCDAAQFPAVAVPPLAAKNIQFDNTFARDLVGFYIAQMPAVAPAPQILQFNQSLADELGLHPDIVDQADQIFSGAQVPDGATPLAQIYAGHQFGGFSPQLGDGRALLLGEVIDQAGARRDIALKGSGWTPFSRGGDGKAAVGPVLREYLVGEAMFALGIPTSRALCAVATGEVVYRGAALPGAVLTRVAASHIRVGTFQFFAARGEWDRVQKLADYAIARHYPHVAETENRYLAFFDAVCGAQARLIAQWMGAGFVHGVMNTDNMTVSGETIDYGPCAFMEGYAPGTVFSSIDQTGRYAYGNQPLILGWNLARLAETLLPLLDTDEDRAVAIATERLQGIAKLYRAEWTDVMRSKLGLLGQAEGDAALAEGLLGAMAGQNADWTLTFRRLSTAVDGDASKLAPLFEDRSALMAWLPAWRARLAPDAGARMDRTNPAIIPRNHLVEAALVAATDGDLAPFRALLAAIADPFGDVSGREAFALPAPLGFGPYKTFCGT